MPQAPTQALLFDLGNVLIDVDFSRALQAWSAYSLLSFDDMRATFVQDLAYQQHETGDLCARDYFASLRASLKLTASDQQIEDGWNAMLLGEIAQTVDAIRKARARFPCYVFTNTNPTHQKVWQTRHATLLTAFERVFVSSEMGLRKPHRAAFDYVAHAMGVAAASILFFDDLPENVAAARDAGFQAVHVRSPADVQTVLRGLGCAV